MQLGDKVLITHRVPTHDFAKDEFTVNAATYPVSPTTVEVREVATFMGANFVVFDDRSEMDMGDIIEGDWFFSLEVVQ